ncbi:glycosyltransferase family 2 protein [Amycolatopsis rhizosphaerae]|uniref:glycosyltransferase family 2 protein n=1 Tax=Amycolatopsis rhizosphaerae TaxID=2053003 RepID=UPI003CCC7411
MAPGVRPQRAPAVALSVVVPCYNEADGIEPLRAALTRALPSIVGDFEVVLVDDGSTDATLERMRSVCRADPRFRYLALSRNFGKESAMLAGLTEATGDAVAIMDADLQHPPELLGPMLERLRAGTDQVVARRTRAGDSRMRSLLARIYYRMMNRLVEVELQDGVGDFRLLSRRAVTALLSLGERNRFSKGLFAWVGYPTGVVEYENVPRRNGTSKWTFGKLVNYAIDGVISFNDRPLRAAIYLGLLCTVLAFGYAAWVVGVALARGNPVPGYVTIMCGVLGLGGLQLLFLGIMGEYLGRIYYETKRRPHFLIKETSDRLVEETSSSTGRRADGFHHVVVRPRDHD